MENNELRRANIYHLSRLFKDLDNDDFSTFNCQIQTEMKDGKFIYRVVVERTLAGVKVR